MEARIISKNELALLYNPGMTPSGARHWLVRQIKETPGLEAALRREGHEPGSRRQSFTRGQCAVILHMLGQP